MNLSQNKTKNIKSFLAHRIFLIILLFAILPLFTYSIILYITEYSQKKKEILQTNQILLNQINKTIEKDIELKQKILDIAIDEIQLKKNATNNFLFKFSRQFNLQGIFYATLRNDNLIIRNSTNSQIIGKNVNNIKGILKNKNALFKGDLLPCLECIYFSKTIFQNDKPIGALVLFVLKKDFFEFKKEELPINADILIIDNFGRVLISTNKNLHYLNVKNQKGNNLFIKTNIKDTSYTLVLSVESKTLQIEHLKKYFLKHGIVLTIIFVFLLIITFFLIRILNKPTNNLLSAMQDIKTGNIQRRFQKQKMGFEINYLGSIFNEMMDSLIFQQHQIEKEKLDKQKYLQELQIAKEIQISLLPDKELDIKNVDIAFGNIFAKEVGGDFYDFIVKDDKVFFVIADISTKGILACLYALTLRSIIRSFAIYFSDLEKIIIQSNKLFMKDAAKNFMFATAFFGIYDIDTKKLQYCNCGHMPAILRKKQNSLEFLTTDGTALGIEDFESVQVKHITLKKEDLLFLYTDGIIDAIDVNNKFFGEKNLYEFIKNTKNLKSKEIVDSLFDSLKIYSKDTLQYDDATVVVIKIY